MSCIYCILFWQCNLTRMSCIKHESWLDAQSSCISYWLKFKMRKYGLIIMSWILGGRYLPGGETKEGMCQWESITITCLQLALNHPRILFRIRWHYHSTFKTWGGKYVPPSGNRASLESKRRNFLMKQKRSGIRRSINQVLIISHQIRGLRTTESSIQITEFLWFAPEFWERARTGPVKSVSSIWSRTFEDYFRWISSNSCDEALFGWIHEIRNTQYYGEMSARSSFLGRRDLWVLVIMHMSDIFQTAA